MKVWIAYFGTKDACKQAHADALREGIKVLASGVGGENPNHERPFIIFQSTEKGVVGQIYFFSENGATDVEPCT